MLMCSSKSLDGSLDGNCSCTFALLKLTQADLTFDVYWQEPEASVDGLGGTYFFMDELGDRAAIVKPCDEEPLAPNNPKVHSLSSCMLRSGH